MKAKINGSSMVEILIAILFVSLVAVALLRLAVINVSTSSYSIQRSQAEDYAKQTLEWLRNEKERDWQTFYNHGTYTWCMPTLTSSSWDSLNIKDCSPTLLADKIPGTVFIREVENTQESASIVGVKVIIFWNDARGYHEITKNAEFSNENY